MIPRASALKRKVVVNDKMQKGYRYQLSAPAGRNFDPEFRPELTPAEMLRLGVFCGKYMTDARKEFPASWFVGAKLAGWVSQSVIRRGIVIVLTLTGLKMLGMPPEWVGIIGAAMLLLGPLAWGFIRQRRGLEPFDIDSTAWHVPEHGPR